jgi:excinuclease UvrABC ATPase subunit
VTEYIGIRGARENNLKDVSLRIPKRKITIFTGVSGSGKSSILFDTIATEAQRQLHDLDPEGGSKGGRVIFEGTPRQLMKAPGSLPGEYLARGRVLAATHRA